MLQWRSTRGCASGRRRGRPAAALAQLRYQVRAAGQRAGVARGHRRDGVVDRFRALIDELLQRSAPLVPLFAARLSRRRGAFHRTFLLGDQVSIEAPAHYGHWWFVGWKDAYGYNLGPQSTNTVLSLTMSSDWAVRADYQYIEEPDFDHDGLPVTRGNLPEFETFSHG